MTIPVSPVTNTQTFGAWLSSTNRLIELVSQNTVTSDATVGGSITTGNSFVNGHFGAGHLYAETALIGGNVSTNSTLNILANVNFTYSGANLTSITANSTSSNLTIGTENTAIVGNTLFVNAVINVVSAATLGGVVTVSNTLTVANVATFNDNINAENIVPQSNVTFDLGSPTNLFKNTYTQTVLFATGSANSTQYTGTANNANNFNGQPASFYTNATNITAGTLDPARLSGTYTINVTGTASNATNLNNQPGSFYTNATNITTGTLPWAQAPSGTVNTSGAFTITGIHTHSANVVMGNTTVNTQLSNATILISNSTSTTTLGLTDLRIGNTATNVIIANTTSSFGGNVSVIGSLNAANVTAALFTGNVTGNVTGTASNATNLNSQPGSFYTNATNITAGTLDPARLSGTYTIDVTGTASNATNLNNQPASFYTNATNITTGTLATARLPATINTTTLNASTVNTINIVANGSTGTAGQVLSANGTGIYWASAASGTVSSIDTGNGLAGGPITSTGTISILANSGIVANSTGTFVNTAFIGTLTANNATNLNNQPASFYTNATNLTTGTVPSARLPSSSTSQAGIVQLVDSVANPSITLAATANSVKAVYDFAVGLAATGTPPSGANTNIQFNNSGSFGGSAAFTFNNTTNTVTVGSQLSVGANASLSTDFLRIGNSTVNTAISAASITLNGVNVNTAITGNAATAFSNATAFASNASNISSGTLANARLPSAVDVTSVNATTLGVSANINIAAAGALVLAPGARLSANGTVGTAGQTLHSNGTSVYWDTDDQGVTSVATGNGLTGGTITTTGTVSVLANNGITANTTGLFVTQGTGTVVNSTGVHVNANNGITANTTGLFVTQGTGAVVNSTGVHVNTAFIGTLTANNATNLNGQPASFYTNASNITTGTLPDARLSAAVVNTSANFTIAGILTYVANVHIGNSTVNTQQSNATILISNSTSTTTLGLTDLRIGNTATNVVIANTTSTFGGNVVITGTANITANLVVGAASELIIANGAGIQANGSFGTSGQVLSSNGTGVYWATLPGVNTAAQFSWTNAHSFSANVAMTGWLDIESFVETDATPAISAGTLTLDLAAAQVFDVSLNANITTLTINNVPATASKVTSFTLVLTADGTTRTIAWPAAFRWPGNTAPTITSTLNKRDVLAFFTSDNGTSWNAFISGQNL